MSSDLFLRPITRKRRCVRHAVLDVESKSGECGACGHFHHGGACAHVLHDARGLLADLCTCPRWVRSQRKGFSRPFLVGFYDGTGDVLLFDNGPVEDVHASPLYLPGEGLGGALYDARPSDEGLPYRPWQESHLLDGGCFRKLLDHVFRLHLGEDERRRYQSENFLLYGHNAGRFDYLFLIPFLVKNGRTFKFEVTTIQSKIQRLDVWLTGTEKKSGYWSFLDSVSLLPMSLDEVGQKLCPKELQKQKSFDLDTDERDPRWREYLKLDCLVLHEGLRAYKHLVEERLEGEVGVTSPATSMKLYRRVFQKKDWIRRNAHFRDCDDRCDGLCGRYRCDGTCHGCAHAYVRRGYYGGRTELFKTWGSDVHYYDINSSYPASMLSDMPVGRMIETGPISWTEMTRLRRTHVGFVRCRAWVPESCAIPPLPYRHERLGKLVFPAGTFEGVWDFDELRLLHHPAVSGNLDRVYSSVWFEKRAVFKAMVETLYPLRDKNSPLYDPALGEIVKLILNSFYGKWGMSEVRTGLVLVSPGEEKPEDGWPMYGDFENDHVWEVERICEASYIVPQIAAHVTALSRIRLFHGLCQVIELGGIPLYTDTDSIMCEWPDADAATRFPTGSKLGEWKREDPGVFLDGEFLLPKLYQLRAHADDCDDPGCLGCRIYFHAPDCPDKKKCPGCSTSKQKMKGVGSRGQTTENWERLRSGEIVEVTRVSQVRTMLSRDSAVPEEVSGKKSLRSAYDKRILRDDGTTTPIVLH